MVELKSNAKALLDRARDAAGPSSEDVSALRERLGFALPPPPPVTTPEAATAPANLVRRLVLTGVAAAALGVAAWAATASPEATHLDPIATFVPELAPAPSRESVPPSLEAPAVPSASMLDAPPPAELKTPSPRRRTQRRSGQQTAEPASDLQAELVLIVQARRALSTGNDSVARTTAQQYGRRFPAGAFAEEAQVLEVIASCNLGRTEATTKRATSYVERGTPSFAQRVRKACLAPSD